RKSGTPRNRARSYAGVVNCEDSQRIDRSIIARITFPSAPALPLSAGYRDVLLEKPSRAPSCAIRFFQQPANRTATAATTTGPARGSAEAPNPERRPRQFGNQWHVSLGRCWLWSNRVARCC